MEPPPDLQVFLANRPIKTTSDFSSAVLDWLGGSGALESPRGIAGSLLDSQSLIYRQIWQAFKTIIPGQVSLPGEDEDSFACAPQGYFVKEVINPILKPLFIGMNVMGGKNPWDNSPRFVSSSFQTSIPAQVAPPVHPRRQARSPSSPLNGTNHSPPPKVVSSPPSNCVYMSKVMSAVNNPKKLMTLLGFPKELVEHPQVTFRLGINHGDYKTFFIDGPPEDPNWAKKVVGMKLKTDLVKTFIHMDFARPRKSQVNRQEAAKEVEAAIRNCFQAQAMEEDDEVEVVRVNPAPGRNKRPISPKRSLFQDDSDAMNSSFTGSDLNSPPPKSARPHQTPAKDGVGGEVNEGEEGGSPQAMEEDSSATEK